MFMLVVGENCRTIQFWSRIVFLYRILVFKGLFSSTYRLITGYFTVHFIFYAYIRSTMADVVYQSYSSYVIFTMSTHDLHKSKYFYTLFYVSCISGKSDSSHKRGYFKMILYSIRRLCVILLELSFYRIL